MQNKQLRLGKWLADAGRATNSSRAVDIASPYLDMTQSRPRQFRNWGGKAPTTEQRRKLFNPDRYVFPSDRRSD